MTTLTEALTTYRPKLVAEFKDYVTSIFDIKVVVYGVDFKGYKSSHTVDRTFTNLIRPLTTVVNVETGERLSVIRPRDDIRHELDSERVARAAEEYADDTITRWKAKIEKKLGELDTFEVGIIKNGRLVIKGTANGHDVVLNQQTILKTSVKGLLFNQFPARIYVDGSFTPEAQFKKAVSQ